MTSSPLGKRLVSAALVGALILAAVLVTVAAVVSL